MAALAEGVSLIVVDPQPQKRPTGLQYGGYSTTILFDGGRMLKYLPEAAQQIAEVIGVEKALLLVGIAKSKCIYIPSKLKPGHKLRRLLGDDDAEAMRLEWGGQIIYLSGCVRLRNSWRNNEICRLFAAGKTKLELMETFELQRRMLEIILMAKTVEDSLPA